MSELKRWTVMAKKVRITDGQGNERKMRGNWCESFFLPEDVDALAAEAMRLVVEKKVLTAALEAAERRAEALEAEVGAVREECPCVRMQDHFDDTPLQAVQFTVSRLISLEAENGRLREAGRALLVVMDSGIEPRKLDEALTWRENDEKARRMMEQALAPQAERSGEQGREEKSRDE